MKSLQDDYCFNTFQGNWKNVPQVFPEELQWEALVGVLRGQVKVSKFCLAGVYSKVCLEVNAHCYEAADLDSLIRVRAQSGLHTIFIFPHFHQLSREFQFPIAAIHHASEAYLVPDRLKDAYGKGDASFLDPVSMLI